jgi:signal transduction histidine kinase/tetratricopeptide (TPR) repeat protein
MRGSVWQRFSPQPGHRLLAVFVICILLPGIVLAVLGLRTLRQERRSADQQIRESLEAAAARTGADLEREFRRWQDAVQAIADATIGDSNSWPQSIQHAVTEPGGAVLVTLSGGRLEAFPPEQLLYWPSLEEEHREKAGPSSSAFTRAEILELRQKDYPGAIRVYKELLDSATPQHRPFYLHRLARSYRKAGRHDAALKAYMELAQLEPVRIGTLPADLIAKYEICSLLAESGRPTELAQNASGLYQDLAQSKWRIEKAPYYYYSERAREWLRDGSVSEEDMPRLQKMLERKLALAEAVEALLPEPRRVLVTRTGVHLTFWKSNPFIALVLSAGFLEAECWHAIFSPGIERRFRFTLSSPEGTLVYGAAADGRPALEVLRTLTIDNRPWLLQVWPQDPDALYSDLRRKQSLYVAMLMIMVALLGFGGYLTARTVKRELEIARMRANFVSTVSHEFRSPLTGIRQLGEMLLDGRVRSEEKQRGYYRLIVQESRRLGRLVENILDFSRMEEGRKEYRFAPLNTSIWLRRLVEDFQSELVEKGISIVSQIPDELPPLTGDAEALGCAVHNLLDNAVKYSPASKTVWFDVKTEDGSIAIAVRDEGAGVSEQDQRHIFEKFYRVDGEISRKIKGAGLGLSLVRHIVTAHGGHVECASRLGEGSTFTIRLPVAPPAAGG